MANNIIKNYGPDQVDIEIVAFGPGLRLLFEDNANTGRIDDLVQNGVRFFACQNTINNMTNTIGRPLKINSQAIGLSKINRLVRFFAQRHLLVKP